MSFYAVELGHDATLESLVPIVPQPRTEGIKATRRTYAADGSAYDEGLYIELIFDVLGNVSRYQALLDMFDLDGSSGNITSEVTVLVRDHTFRYVRMNGIAVRPQPGPDVRWQMPFPRGITILIKNLEPAS
jgi:hypothetical protein